MDIDHLRKQDEELDELSLSVQRIGGVGLTIHEELLGQEKILDELGNEMDKKSGDGDEEDECKGSDHDDM
ncbi:hypothetical protein TSUD_258260, partial [Trifolium subterraneum]